MEQGGKISTDEVRAYLTALRNKGVTLWSEHGRLRYKAPKGALTTPDIDRLRASKAQILAFLERTANDPETTPSLTAGRNAREAPLAFSQLAHWNLFRLAERPAICLIASITRWQGRLNVDALERSLREIVRRHDALRTRIVVSDGVPLQHIDECGGFELLKHDLSAYPESDRDEELARRIESALAPIDLAREPLFAARLLKVREEEHVLILAVEHIVADAWSRGILLGELFAAYRQALAGEPFGLPPVSLQFSDYAARLRRAERSWVDAHGEYWTRHLQGCPRLRFLDDAPASGTASAGWGLVPVAVGRETRQRLNAWCRANRTTLVLAVFAAYAAAVLRWCRGTDCIVQFQSDGRIGIETENTVGYFAAVLHLRIRLSEADTFIDVLQRATDEYCTAYEHIDFSYLAAQMPRPEFTRNTAFNWVPHRSNSNGAIFGDTDEAIACSPVSFVHPMVKRLDLDHEPSILLLDMGDEIVGNVSYPRARFSAPAMEAFARCFVAFLGALLESPHGRVPDAVRA